MLTRIESVQNNNCVVTYNYQAEGVIVQSNDFLRQRIFGGFHWLLDRYRELAFHFNEEVSFEDACDYFILNDKESEIYQPQ